MSRRFPLGARAHLPLGALLLVVGLGLHQPRGHAHDGEHPSVHDTVAGIVQRLRHLLDERSLRALSPTNVVAYLNDSEREVLGSAHLRFVVDQPATVTVLRDVSLEPDPFWLRDGSWRQDTNRLRIGDVSFDRWEKDVPAGPVGLGVNSLRGGGAHYLVAVASRSGQPLAVSDLYPAHHRTLPLTVGAVPWPDRTNVTLGEIPPDLVGRTLVQTLHAARDDAKLLGRFHWTEHPASSRPDQVVLTWSADPRTTQTVQWRTSVRVRRGVVEFREAAPDDPDEDSPRRRPRRQVRAFTTTLLSESTLNDPLVHRHTAHLAGLRPDTTYRYRVGSGDPGEWSSSAEFTTAPAQPGAFSFVYMGDAQNGLETWGRLVRGAYRARPDVAFYLMAGDLVNRGNDRDDWDEFFHAAAPVFNRRTLVPVLGNHECQGGQPTLYLRQFALPRNGPAGLEPERAYSFEYSGALFVVLDSNLAPATQSAWLEDRLARSRARWKIVSYHHPAYSSAPRRDNLALRSEWTPIFERHGVDLALQGHDHAYLRTHPLRAGQPSGSTATGTTYIVSYSGTKGYSQDATARTTAIGFTNVPTWQVLDLEINPLQLHYRAFDRAGHLRDEFTIDKSPQP